MSEIDQYGPRQGGFSDWVVRVGTGGILGLETWPVEPIAEEDRGEVGMFVSLIGSRRLTRQLVENGTSEFPAKRNFYLYLWGNGPGVKSGSIRLPPPPANLG